MKVVHESNGKLFDRYYSNQAGSGGGVDVFRGTRMQKGHGLGGLFRGLFKSAMPLLKSGMKAAAPMLKRGAKTLGKQVLDSGMNLAGDLLDGESIKSSARKRVLEAKNQLKRKALQTMIYSGPPGKRTRRRKTTRNPKRQKDIFDA